jgi:hypothetical protein
MGAPLPVVEAALKEVGLPLVVNVADAMASTLRLSKLGLGGGFYGGTVSGGEAFRFLALAPGVLSATNTSPRV